MLRSRKLPRLHQAVRWLEHPLSSRVVILMYHRVTELANDPYLLAVTPEHFAEQMEVVRKFYFPISLEQLAQALRGGKIPKRAVVVTFDDGYADNLYNAKPILERYEIPAMVFVTTGHIGSPSEFWWDELDRLLLQPGTLPVLCELPLNGRTLHCQLDEAAAYTTADYERHRAWHIEREDDPTPRHRLHRSLYQLLHNLTATHKQQILSDLRTWAGAQPVGRSTHRNLSVEELTHLADQRLIEIGAHTVTHPVLATLPVATQRDEILQSRTRIEELVGRSVLSFAYPHGSYTQDTLAVVREAGFTSACSSDTEVVRRGTDAFQLPRICVRDWDGQTFSRWLRGWLCR